MPNIGVCHNFMGLNINFNNQRGFRDDKICRKYKFQGTQAKLKGKICFDNLQQKIVDKLMKSSKVVLMEILELIVRQCQTEVRLC